MIDDKTLYINTVSGDAQLGSDWLADFKHFKATYDKYMTFDEWESGCLEVVEIPLMTRDVIERAKNRFIEFNGDTLPAQLNVKCHFRDGWEIEFREHENSFSEGFLLWLSGKDVKNIFENIDVKKLQHSIDFAWDDEFFDIT